MLYTKHNIGDLDLGKYKRFVAIGCSFTRWLWPSWSDLLAREMPNTQYINCARGGAGTFYIVTMLNLLSRRHNFDSDTLVGIMWSTFCRQDWFNYENPRPWEQMGKKGGWHSQGNLLINQYNDPFVNFENLEPFHYLIRDAGMIATANQYLKTTQFDTLNLSALDLEAQIPHGVGHDKIADRDPGDEKIRQVLHAYKDMDDEFVGYLYRQGGEWPEAHVYPTPDRGIFHDYHPKSIDYVDYLESWGIPISSETRDFAQSVSQHIDDVTDPDWLLDWPYESNPSHEDEISFYQRCFTEV